MTATSVPTVATAPRARATACRLACVRSPIARWAAVTSCIWADSAPQRAVDTLHLGADLRQVAVERDADLGAAARRLGDARDAVLHVGERAVKGAALLAVGLRLQLARERVDARVEPADGAHDFA